jgi:hypothetical protein
VWKRTVGHRDSIGLSLLSPLFDFHQGVLNCVWIIATFDQGTRWEDAMVRLVRSRLSAPGFSRSSWGISLILAETVNTNSTPGR